MVGVPGSPVHTWEEVARAAVGFQVDVEDSSRRRDRLNQQTRVIADKLMAAGILSERHDAGLSTVGDLSGDVQVLTAYRHIQLLPKVAARDRAVLMRDLQYFLKHLAGGYCRYGVVTSGERVPFGGDLRGQMRAHRRKISRWAAAALDFGIEVLFRGDEYTFTALGAHGHSNVLYRPIRKLSRQEWKEFLEWSWKFLGTHWRDCGVLKDIREVVKYICKLAPAEKQDDGSISLDMLTPDQIAWLHHANYRCKISQPMGRFAAFRNRLKVERQRIVWKRCGGAGMRLVKMAKRPVKDRQERGEGGGGVCPENLVMSRCLPSPGPDGILETHTVVANYTPQPSTLFGQDGLRIIAWNQAQAREWAKGRAPARKGVERIRVPRAPFRVHNVTPTVLGMSSIHLPTSRYGGPVYRLVPRARPPPFSGRETWRRFPGHRHLPHTDSGWLGQSRRSRDRSHAQRSEHGEDPHFDADSSQVSSPSDGNSCQAYLRSGRAAEIWEGRGS